MDHSQKKPNTSIESYRVPSDSATSLYFKKFPSRYWSHKHFVEQHAGLNLRQASALWFKNLSAIKALPGSPVNSELLFAIKKRKMADASIVNKRKRKIAEDDVHTTVITTSAMLLKDGLGHHKKHTEQRLYKTPEPSNLTPTPIGKEEISLVATHTESDNSSDEIESKSDLDSTFDHFIDGEEDIPDIFSLGWVPPDNATAHNSDSDERLTVGQTDISALFGLYQSNAWKLGQKSGLSITTNYHEILSLSNILLLQTDKCSDMQIKTFTKDTLEVTRRHIKHNYLEKCKVGASVKAVFREYIETALDEDLGLYEAEVLLRKSFTKKFEDPLDREIFHKMQLIFFQLIHNIPLKPLDEHVSEGTLTANIISPILRALFHDPATHPTMWPNTASASAKVRKLASHDSSRAKQPDMIGTIVKNNKSAHEIMFGEITGEGTNNTVKKNTVDLIRLGIFMKDALDDLLLKTSVKCTVFSWQAIVTKWTGYCMTLVAPGLYVMIEVGQAELPRSFQTCGQFIDSIDNLMTFMITYENRVEEVLSAIDGHKYYQENTANMNAILKWRRCTLGTPSFRKLTKA